MGEKLTEAQAVAALKRLAARWPANLWLFSNGTLTVMRLTESGERAHVRHGGFDPAYAVATINIPNDGGDW